MGSVPPLHTYYNWLSSSLALKRCQILQSRDRPHSEHKQQQVTCNECCCYAAHNRGLIRLSDAHETFTFTLKWQGNARVVLFEQSQSAYLINMLYICVLQHG